MLLAGGGSSRAMLALLLLGDRGTVTRERQGWDWESNPKSEHESLFQRPNRYTAKPHMLAGKRVQANE